MDASIIKFDPSLIFVFDDAKGLNAVKQFDWGSLAWNRRNEYAGGNTCRINLGYKHYCRRFSGSLLVAAEAALRGIDPDVKVTSLHTFFTVLSDPTMAVEQKLHSDSESPNIWSLLYHIEGTDGATEFADEVGNVVHSVEFKPGRLIIFPSVYRHHGCLPTQGRRIILNAIVEMDFKFNNSVYLC